MFRSKYKAFYSLHFLLCVVKCNVPRPNKSYRIEFYINSAKFNTSLRFQVRGTTDRRLLRFPLWCCHLLLVMPVWVWVRQTTSHRPPLSTSAWFQTQASYRSLKHLESWVNQRVQYFSSFINKQRILIQKIFKP